VHGILKRTFSALDWRRLSSLQRRKAIPCKLFLKAKFHPHTGDFLKLKARLVGCQLKSRADPEDADIPSSPTLSSTGFLIFLTVATKKGFILGTGDVPQAYLHAKTDPKFETIHAVFDKATTKIALDVNPELQALVDDKGRLWGRLDYSLYGLLQSGLNWYRHISNTLKEMGFKASDAEPCLFMGTIDGEEVLIGLYVDDLLVAARLRATIRSFFRKLDKIYPGVYDTMCCDEVLTYLGTSIDCSERGVTYVHQPEFCKKLIEDFDKGTYGPVKPRSTPAPLDLMTIDEESPLLEKDANAYYRSTLMRLAFLVNTTRFDLKVALMALSRRMHCATKQDMKRLGHLIGYVAATPNHGLTIRPGDGDLRVYSYTDSSHATMYDLRSVTGGLVCAGDGGTTVFAKCSKQTIIAKSSMECEYIACSDVASQVIHVRNIFMSLGIPQPPAIIYVDNTSAIHVIKNGRPKAMLTRHIRIREAWVTERCDNDELAVEHIPTSFQVADCLTKPLAGALLQRMTEWLLGWVPHPGPKNATKKSEKKGANAKTKRK
jgi:hypothetical protein